MKRLIVAAVLALAAVVAVPSSAVGAVPYPSTVSSPTAGAGDRVQYTAKTPLPAGTMGTAIVQAPYGSIITVALVTHTVATRADGTVTFTVNLPASAPTGAVYTVAWRSNHPAFTAAARKVTVVATSASSQGGTAGIRAFVGLWFGGGLLALLVAWVVVTRINRRNRKTAPTI